MSDLEILYPKPVVVRVNGRRVAIKPVEFRHFEAFGKAAGELLTMLSKASPEQIYAWAQRSGALLDVLGACTSLWRWRIRRLPSTVAVQLMLQVVEVNNDFFGQALAKVASR